MGKKRIVLGVTGSIAAYKAADIIRRLQEKGVKVSVVMTSEAQRFITPLTLATLSGEPVGQEMFGDSDTAWQMNHLRLTQEADALLIAPATGNIIGKMANGLADDLLSCLVLASKVPIIVAPAMNEDMYHNRIVQQNIKKLKDSGIKFVDPVKGELACGTYGEGHIADIKDIIKAVDRLIG